MGSLLPRKCYISIDLPFKIKLFFDKQGVSHTISALFSSLALRLWSRNGDLYPSSLALLGIFLLTNLISFIGPLRWVCLLWDTNRRCCTILALLNSLAPIL